MYMQPRRPGELFSCVLCENYPIDSSLAEHMWKIHDIPLVWKSKRNRWEWQQRVRVAREEKDVR